MAKGCVYIPKTGKDAGKVFGSKESLAAHMNYTPALTDLMAKFEQSGGKTDIDSVTKWLSDNGYLKEKPAGKPSRRERLAKMFEEPKVEVAPEVKPAEQEAQPSSVGVGGDVEATAKALENQKLNDDEIIRSYGSWKLGESEYVDSKGVHIDLPDSAATPNEGNYTLKIIPISSIDYFFQTDKKGNSLLSREYWEFDNEDNYQTENLDMIKEGFDTKNRKPIIVETSKDGLHSVVDGHHRLTIAKELGRSSILALVREYDGKEFYVKKGDNYEAISKAYHKAKEDGSNPELIKAVEQSLKETPKAETPSQPQKQKPFSGIKNLFKKGFGGKRISEREAQSLNRELNTLIDRAEKENGVQRDRLKHATWRTNDGYTITEFFENKRDGTRIVTPEGEEINLYGNKYKNESGQDISYFPEAGKPAVTESEKPTIAQAEEKPAEEVKPSEETAEKPKTKLEEKKALDQSVNELINKKNRYNKIAKRRKPLAGNLLNEIKDEAERLGFALSPALGGNIKLVSKKDGKVVARRSVDRGFNKERNEKVKAAKGMASDFTFGLRGSILLYFLNGGKISTTSSELGKDSKELIAAKKAGIVSDTGTSASSIAKEDLPEMGAVVFDELDAVAEIQGVVASFENKAQMEDELVDMLDEFNRGMEEAAEYDSMRKVNQGIEEGRIDEGEYVDYFELLPEDEKIKLVEEYEKFKQQGEFEQLDQQGEGVPGDVAPAEQEETAGEPKSKRLQRAEELRAKAQDLRDASGGTLMAGPKLLAAAYEAYAAILETTENIIDAIKKFKATKEYKDLDVNGKKELDVVLATDAVEEEISSGRDPQEAVDDLIGSQEWYQSLPANQKEQLDEILKDDFGVVPVAKTGIKATIANIIDNYYKGDRQSKLDNKRILESDPKLKYIYDNISKINKQLQDAGVITDKTDGCP